MSTSKIITIEEEEAVIALLRPVLARRAYELKQLCKEAGFVIQIVRGLRTIEEQDEFYTQGRTRPGEIITMVQGGYSFHNFGVAFDIRPVEQDEEQKKLLYTKAGPLGEKLGLEWGGSWKDFIDMPHFQYTAGYSVEDFRLKKVDWGKFD
jgi:peptidoglycan L-alanyl-D-glutamate endopeptidase CwlK